jgi:catechol 2,3-dioxygenase
LPAQRKWFEQATNFVGTPVSEPERKPNPMTLETYLSKQQG